MENVDKPEHNFVLFNIVFMITSHSHVPDDIFMNTIFFSTNS